MIGVAIVIGCDRLAVHRPNSLKDWSEGSHLLLCLGTHDLLVLGNLLLELVNLLRVVQVVHGNVEDGSDLVKSLLDHRLAFLFDMMTVGVLHTRSNVLLNHLHNRRSSGQEINKLGCDVLIDENLALFDCLANFLSDSGNWIVVTDILVLRNTVVTRQCLDATEASAISITHMVQDLLNSGRLRDTLADLASETTDISSELVVELIALHS